MAIRTIVAALALDGDDEPAARRALRLAAEHEARLVLVHAVESLSAPDLHLPPPQSEETIARVLMAEAVESLERMAASATARAEVRVARGRASRVIDRVMRDQAADLLVIGPGKPHNLRERMFGSTADRLARSGSCPMLVVKRAGDGPYRRAIAAIDFSPMSFAAARMAAQIAPSAALELIHAVEIPLTFEQAMLKAGTSQAGIDRYRKARARAAHAELRSAYASLSVPGRIRVVHGNAAAALTRLARSGKTDLVALGIQGRNAVSTMVLGSVARQVLARSSCDVLLANEPDRPG